MSIPKVTHCPKCRVQLRDLATAVPWCDRCAWTPPEIDLFAVAIPVPHDEGDEQAVVVEPERFEGDADAEWYRRSRLPEQDAESIRAAIHNEKKPPRWLGVGWRRRWLR